MDPLLPPIHPSHTPNIQQEDEEGEGEEGEEDIVLLSTPSPSSGVAVAGSGSGSGSDDDVIIISSTPAIPPPRPPKKNRYDEQKRRDWIAFHRFLDNHQPRLTLSRVRSTHVIEFLKSVDGFGKTLVHEAGCPHYGRPDTPLPPCACPLRQSWGSLDALIGRLRAACEESPVRPETNPFGVRTVRDYLLHIKDVQANARGIPYSRKRKTQPNHDHPQYHEAEATTPPPLSSLLEVEAAAAAAAGVVGEAPATASIPLPGDASAPVPPPALVPLVGSIGQDGPQLPMQICWVRPPVMDNHSSLPFFPIWRYPGTQSLVPFLPPFPYMPTPPPQRRMETEIRVKEELIAEEDDPDADLLITREGPSSSNEGGGADATHAATENSVPPSQQKNRYEEQKRRDWNSFLRFLENHQPPLTLSKVRSPHVLEFLKSVDQFGKTLVHEPGCPYYGNPNPPAPCGCPLRQSWGSLDALNGRLRAACEECPNRPETNPFGVRIIRNYLLHIKDSQATARGIPYSRKKKRDLPAASAEGPQPPLDGVGDGQNLLAVDAATELPRDPLEGAGDGQPESAVAAAVAVMANTCMGEEASGNLGSSSCDYGVDDFTSAVFSPPIITSVAVDGSSDLPCASSSPSSL